MDPLSVTLAVISLTTAVKDMVELGRRIHESFGRASDNFLNAQRVAKDIKEMMEEIMVFCDDNKDSLDNMKNFRSALHDLLAKFRSFETSILPLLLQMGGRKRIFRGWDAWRNSNKVERSLLNLQSDILKVMRSYIVKSAMRTELKLNAICQETRSGFSDVRNDTRQGLEVLEVVRREVSALRITGAATSTTHYPYSSSGMSSDECNRNVIAFAQSTSLTSAPMLQTPNVITEELLTTAYIKVQLCSIITTLQKPLMSSMSTLDDVEKFRFSRPVELASMNITRIRQHAVQYVLRVRLLFEERMETTSIYTAANALNGLSIWLGALNMHQEENLVGDWTLTRARTLVDGSDSQHPDCSSILALYLLNQSCRYRHSGDMVRGLQTIEEAYMITQELRNQYRGEVEFQILYGEILSQYARFVDIQRSIEMCVEAVQVLEDILDVRAVFLSESPQKIQRIARPDSTFVDHLFSSAPPISAMMAYTHALQELVTYLFEDDQREIVLDLALLAVAVLRKMVSVYGPDYKAYLATTLSSLVQDALISCMPTEELVDMADECLQLLEELAQINPMRYARHLVLVLWVKARILMRLTRDSEAIATYEKSASIAGQILQDAALRAMSLYHLRRQFKYLGRHDDAVRTGTLAITICHHADGFQGYRYSELCEDLCALGHYKESVEAARTAITLYRNMAMKDPDRWMCDLCLGLSTLAHCLAALGNYSEAALAYTESSLMLGNFLNAKQSPELAVLARFRIAAERHTMISYVTEEKEQCLKISHTAFLFIQKLSKIYPQDEICMEITTRNLLWAGHGHAYNLLRVGCPQDAYQWIDHSINSWISRPASMLEFEFPEWHAGMIALKADVLDAMGCTEQALLVTKEVHDCATLDWESIRARQPSGKIHLIMHKARLQADLGQIEEALHTAEAVLQLSRDNEPELTEYDMSLGVLLSLYAVAFTALSCRNYERVIETAREGCGFYAKLNTLQISELEREHHAFLRPNLYAFMSSAEANLGRLSVALEYANRAVDLSLDIANMKLYVSATTAEHCYMETRGYLGDILLATGDIVQARQIYEERRVYFSERVERRMGDYRELGPILRVLGVLHCAEGNHEEGEAAAQELFRIMKMLGSAFPSLQEQVKIRLRRQAEVPILKVLNDMCQALDCNHQTEVASLFEV